MRRWDHGNGRINFGFCKGDDNFGGRKRKELDDFCKSLGKQMNLVMYRMEYTERVRTKLREDRRRAVREKAEMEEQREKTQMERIEKNRKWREKKSGAEKLNDDLDDKVLDEKEERKMKNKEWREKRESLRYGNSNTTEKEDTLALKGLSNLILTELHCPFCHEEMCPPKKVYQCVDGHNLCEKCRSRDDMKESLNHSYSLPSIILYLLFQACPLCMAHFSGRNAAVEKVAALLFLNCGFDDQEQESKSFTFMTTLDSGLAETEDDHPNTGSKEN